ncbi:MAG TPA: DUF2950 domain-containing protein [Xanthomonadales bacterium]|nr:DUF2950 domain-containing protein [Xanthomonadales bacterium]
MNITIRNKTRALLLLPLLVLLAGCNPADPGKFQTPEAAVQAMYELIGQNDDQAIEATFGPGSADLFHSGDDAADQEDVARVKAMMEEQVAFEEFDENTRIALFGEDSWPFPIPLVRDGDSWRFSIEDGREELLNRRIGRNELWTLSVMHEIVDAQREYHASGHDGNPPAFAARFLSSDGKQDGLYWPSDDEDNLSPLGDLLAESDATATDAQPFHGYFYRILTRQGAGAPGGERQYLDDQGLLTRGFAVVAWPAKYGNSGVMTFITNHRGLVWQKDLGEDTETVAAAMETYDPDSSWSPTSDYMIETD